MSRGVRGVFWSSFRRKLFTVLSSLTIAAVLIASFLFDSALAAVTVDTSTVSTPTQYSFQRKTWHDGTYQWTAFHSGSQIEFWYSTNGVSWTQNTSATLAVSTSDFSIEADSSYMFITYLNGTDTVEARAASSYPGTGFTLGSATTVFNASLYLYRGPTIERDTDGKVRILVYEVTDALQRWMVTKLSTTANSVSAFGSKDTLEASGNTNHYGTIVALSGGDMYAIWIDNTTIEGSKYTAGVGWDTTPSMIATGTSGATTTLSAVSNTATDEIYLTYIDSGGNTVFQKYVDKQGGDGVKINDASNAGLTVAEGGRKIVRDSNGSIYTLLYSVADGECHLWKSTDNGSSWVEQDSADAPVCSGESTNIAIDSTDVLHLIYGQTDGSDPWLQYNTFSSGQYGTSESLPTNYRHFGDADIAVDSNNKPHIVHRTISFLGAGIVEYSNKVSSFSLVNVESVSSVSFNDVSITINEDNIPEISYMDNTSNDLTAAVGNQNNATSFTLQDIDPSASSTDQSRGTSIGIDSAGNTLVSYSDFIVTEPDLHRIAKHNDADAWSTWSTAAGVNYGKESSLAISGLTATSLFQDNADDVSKSTYISSNGQLSTLKTGTFQDVSVRWASYANYKNGPLDFLYSDGTDIYYSNTGFWNEPVVLDSNSGNAYPTIGVNTTNNDLFVFWIRSNVLYYKKGVSTHESADWDVSATSLYSTGTNTWSTSAYQSGGSRISVIWTSGAGSPYDVKWDSISFQDPPSQPTLSTPASGATGQSISPSFTFSTTDPQSDYVRYRLYLYQSDCSTVVGSSPFTQPDGTPQTGWSGQDTQSSTAYLSGSTATYTYQSTLSLGTTYCWKVDARDPGGSNTYSAISATRLFTTNSVPAAPTLIEPSSGSTGQSTLPIFNLRTTDDLDYLRYYIQLYDATACGGSLVRTIDQSSSQTGWYAQDQSSATAYGSNPVLASSSVAYHQYQEPQLTPNHLYSWRARAIDPAGTNSYSSYSSCQDFTTSTHEVRIRGGVNITGGTLIN